MSIPEFPSDDGEPKAVWLVHDDGPEQAERLASHRFMPVIGDYMEPDFKSGDLAAVAPATAYSGAGTYVLDTGIGPALWCAEKMIGSDRIAIRHANPRHTQQEISVASFNDSVLGKVFAAVHILDRKPLLDWQRRAKQ